MDTLNLKTVKVGDILPPLTLELINRTTLALFAGASNDHNPMHIDIDFARKGRMPDVFAQGMLSLAYLGRLLTQWVDQKRIRQLNARFVGITHLGHQVTCTGRVAELIDVDGEACARVEIRSSNQYGEAKIVGDAVISL